MVGRPVYLLVFLMPSPRLELRTLAGYTTHLENYMLHFDGNLGSYFVDDCQLPHTVSSCIY